MLLEQTHFPLDTQVNNTNYLGTVIVIIILLIGIGVTIYGLKESEPLTTPSLKPIPNEKQ
jgi:hypothetical protein